MKKGRIYEYIAISREGQLLSEKTSQEIEENYTRCHWCYMHGKLEHKVGFDCFLIENSFDQDKLKEKHRGKTGVYRCKIIIDNEYEICIFYYWTPKEIDSRDTQHGLLVLENDEDARKYALKCYMEKKSFI